jgi:dihydroorotase
VAHCEDDVLIKQNLEAAQRQYGKNIPFAQHQKIRSAEACCNATSRAVALAKKYGTQLHVAHISTARELELFGDCTKITAETCPQYLWFYDNDYAKMGAFVKCNPAVKTLADRTALRNAVNSGQITSIATDHAPHTLQEKQNAYLNAPSGLPLIQHSLVSMLQLVKQKIFSLETLVEKMCHAPARIFNIHNRGFIRPNYYADITIVDPSTKWKVSKENILYKCGWSPFEGVEFSHKIVLTLVNGNVAFDNSGVVAKTRGMLLSSNIPS